MSGESCSRRKTMSHGTGEFSLDQFAHLGQNVIFETGVLVFHPENVEIGDDVYVGHYTSLKGYYKNKIVVGDGTWIGQQCFFHGAGGLTIGCNVGIGPGVKIVTSYHSLDELDKPILHSPVLFASVVIGDGSDIGVGATILPGVRIGRGAQVGAGAVVASDVEDFAIVAGVPAKVIRMRK
jgi:acetyltransferase-like isoleucine patch superfamily enzyme